jgi:transposase
VEVCTYDVGALPLINHILDRMGLEEVLTECLPEDDPRCKLSTRAALLVLVRNVIMSREPIYGVGEWVARFAPDLFDLWPEEVALLADDRLGRRLQWFHEKFVESLILTLLRRVVEEFQVSLEQLHNDSTTVSFYGAYRDQDTGGLRLGRAAPIITWGHNKDHRPDLKQLLYTLTVSDDGAVPVYFTTSSGNTADDRTHIPTWKLLCELVGRTDFLYVADCKLASMANLDYIASRGGRFITVLPRTRKEDKQFRARLRESPSVVRWRLLYEVTDDQGEVLDRLSTCDDETSSSDGYRLLWYHSTRKAALDRASRGRQIERALVVLGGLQTRLASPRTRFRQRPAVEQQVDKIVAQHEVSHWLTVQIHEQEEVQFKQAAAGRPGPDTPYSRSTRPRFALSWEINHAALSEAEREDGMFPLLSNDRTLSAEDILRAYKRQPFIEKRFSQFKTDFGVAPVYLKDPRRINALLTVYFFALMAQALLERELRQAMAEHGLESLPLYPEGRPCKRPTTARLVELFETVQRHEVHTGDGEPQVMVTELTPVQRQVVELLGLAPETYGHGYF